MSILKATTRGGSDYLIDTEERRWARNSNFVSPRLISLKTLPIDPWISEWREANAALAERPEVEAPVVGERLFVLGKDDGHLSTEVVSVEDVSKDYAPSA